MSDETTTPTSAPEVPTAPVPAKPDYQSMVGKTFTNGTEEVVIRRVSQPINVKGKDGIAFYVSTKNPLVNMPVNADDFLKTFTLKQ